MILEAPAALAPIMTASPTHPQPNTATLDPACIHTYVHRTVRRKEQQREEDIDQERTYTATPDPAYIHACT